MNSARRLMPDTAPRLYWLSDLLPRAFLYPLTPKNGFTQVLWEG